MTDSLYHVSISLSNETQGYRLSDWTEPIDEMDLVDGKPDFGSIYRTAQKEYGRCDSSVYVDVPTPIDLEEVKDQLDGLCDAGACPPTRHRVKYKRIGWHFVSRQRYVDVPEFYLQGAWVTVVRIQPAVTTSVEIPSRR